MIGVRVVAFYDNLDTDNVTNTTHMCTYIIQTGNVQILTTISFFALQPLHRRLLIDKVQEEDDDTAGGGTEG